MNKFFSYKITSQLNSIVSYSFVFFLFIFFIFSVVSPSYLWADTYTDDSNDAGEFGGGSHSDTQWDAGNSWLELDATGQTNGVATFTSRIIDAESNARWDTLSWIPQRPTYKELPDNEAKETAYNTGNADMSSTTALFHFNESAGATSFADSSGNGNTATCVDCPVVTSTGRFNNAFTFDGVDDSVLLPSQPVGSLVGPTFTIAFWVNPGAVADVPTFGFTNSMGTNAFNPVASYEGGVNIGNGGSSQILAALPAATANQWTHYAIVDDGTNYVRYMNGSLLGSTNITTHPESAGNRSMIIGQTGFNGGFEQPFAGAFDEFVVISHGSSATEVLDMYKRGALRHKFQVRSCNDNACAGESFVGPDGTASTFYTELTTSTVGTPQKTLTNLSRNQYFQYRTIFETSSSTLSPELKSVSVQNTGAGPAGVTITQSGGTTTVTEGGATDSYTIVLDGQPLDDTTLSVSPGSDCTVSTSTIVFTSDNWDDAVTVTVTGTNDQIAQGAHSCAITHTSVSDDSDFDEIAIDSVSVSITDNDSAGVTITESGGSVVISEAGVTDTYTVVLTSAPTSTVTVSVTPDAQSTVSTSSIAFTSVNWNVPVTVTVTAVNDAVSEGAHVSTITHTAVSGSWNYNGIGIASATADITDNDSAGVTITQSGGTTTATEGGATDSYTIVLNTAPTSTVTVSVTPDAQSTVSTSSIAFTSSNWDDAVTVTVTAVNDSIAQGTHGSTITHSSASLNVAYNGIGVDSVVASITDNDSAGITVTESGGDTAISEAGVTDTFTIVLTSAPTSTVTVTVAGDADATVSTSSIAFTSSNWDDAVTVTVTAVDDAVVEGAHTATVSFSVESDNWNYDDFVVADLTADVTDNDAAGGGGGGGGGGSGGSSSVGVPALPATFSLMSTPDTVTLLPEATLIQVEEARPIIIYLDGLPHTITQVGRATAKRVSVVIRSTPVQVVLLKGKTKKVDIDGDKAADVSLLYLGLRQNKPEIRVTALDIQTSTTTSPVLINQGAASTNVRDVLISLSVPGVSSMALSENKQFQNISFTPYISSTPWTLSPGYGEKTVYVRFRSESGATADAFDRIQYVEKTPERGVSPTPPVSHTPTVVVTPKSDQTKEVFVRFLSYGNIGQEVRELQKILQKLHFVDTAPTGFFGPVTRAGLIAFQKAYGIDPFGYVGPATRAALNRLNAGL